MRSASRSAFVGSIGNGCSGMVVSERICCLATPNYPMHMVPFRQQSPTLRPLVRLLFQESKPTAQPFAATIYLHHNVEYLSSPPCTSQPTRPRGRSRCPQRCYAPHRGGRHRSLRLLGLRLTTNPHDLPCPFLPSTRPRFIQSTNLTQSLSVLLR